MILHYTSQLSYICTLSCISFANYRCIFFLQKFIKCIKKNIEILVIIDKNQSFLETASFWENSESKQVKCYIYIIYHFSICKWTCFCHKAKKLDFYKAESFLSNESMFSLSTNSLLLFMTIFQSI